MSHAHGADPEQPWPGIEVSAQTIEFGGKPYRLVGRTAKRALDIIVASISILLLSPVFLLIAVIIKVSDGGPIFYSHTRLGCNGAPFGCLKFRSMKVDAAARLTQLLEADATARQEWETMQKLRKDPRVTVVGGILRRSSLDELPQLINVLRGEMSLVGPRPITVEEQARYGEHIAAYFAVRPGLTGRWQTSGRSDVSYQYRVSLDVQYVRSWSMLGDLLILAKTIPILFSQRGSY